MGEASAARRGRRASTGALLLAATVALAGCGGLRNPLAGDAPEAEAAAPAPAVGERCSPTPAASSPTPPTRSRSPATATRSRASRAGSAPRPRTLARRNALPEDYLLRAGRGAAAARQRVAARRRARRRRASAPSRSAGRPRAPRRRSRAARRATTRSSNGQTEPLIDPVRHRVEAGETAYSIARLYGVSVTALASWNGLGPDLAVRENQELLIPIVGDANRISTEPAETQPGQATPVGAAAERRGAAAGRHHRRGRPGLAEPRRAPHPAGRPAEPAGLGQRQPPLRRRRTRTASASPSPPAPR